jgi:AcrR family transcriptional regulator
MDVRTRLLEAAESLLDASPDRDISTRAVCEAVGVGAPMLYRLFGDKTGLLSAVVDHGFERYLATKRAAKPSDDPVADLRAGWDTHVAFALDHPAVYRLMFSPTFSEVPRSRSSGVCSCGAPRRAGSACCLISRLRRSCRPTWGSR